MKLEHETLVTNDGKKIITGTWRTDSGKATAMLRCLASLTSFLTSASATTALS